MTEGVTGLLAALRIVPVVEVSDTRTAVPLARALAEAGLPAMEITLRTPVALDAIRAIVAEVADFAVGAGTLLSPGDIVAAADAGATFLVSPGRTDALSDAAAASELPFIPGAVTASEVMQAAHAGHRILKFFPAEQAGGAAVIASLAAPLRALGVRFMPTGGIRPENVHRYLALPEVFAVGGTWIAPKSLLDAGRFDLVADRARAALASASTPLAVKEES